MDLYLENKGGEVDDEPEEKKVQEIVPEKIVFLTREQLLAADDIQTEVIYVPEWKGHIKIRGLTNGEVARCVKLATRNKDQKIDTMLSSLWMFTTALVEPKLQDIDVDELKKKSALLMRIVKDISRISGLGENALEDEIKN